MHHAQSVLGVKHARKRLTMACLRMGQDAAVVTEYLGSSWTSEPHDSTLHDPADAQQETNL
jgi:hypothetical protein